VVGKLPPRLCQELGTILQASRLQVWPDRGLLGTCNAVGYFIKVLASVFSSLRAKPPRHARKLAPSIPSAYSSPGKFGRCMPAGQISIDGGLKRAAKLTIRKAGYYCPPKFQLRLKSTRTLPLHVPITRWHRSSTCSNARPLRRLTRYGLAFRLRFY
jgi:hypothetical protein